jgi:hypothetical protein
MKGKAWTDEENAQLRELVARGVSVARAAAIFGRKMFSVRKHARTIGSPFRIPPVKRSTRTSPDPLAD